MSKPCSPGVQARDPSSAFEPPAARRGDGLGREGALRRGMPGRGEGPPRHVRFVKGGVGPRNITACPHRVERAFARGGPSVRTGDSGGGSGGSGGGGSGGSVSWSRFWYTNPDHGHRLASLNGSGGGDHPEGWDHLRVKGRRARREPEGERSGLQRRRLHRPALQLHDGRGSGRAGHRDRVRWASVRHVTRRSEMPACASVQGSRACRRQARSRALVPISDRHAHLAATEVRWLPGSRRFVLTPTHDCASVRCSGPRRGPGEGSGFSASLASSPQRNSPARETTSAARPAAGQETRAPARCLDPPTVGAGSPRAALPAAGSAPAELRTLEGPRAPVAPAASVAPAAPVPPAASVPPAVMARAAAEMVREARGARSQPPA